ncbi:hypothetical protein LMG29739_05741 [Paraburkholderia solisilvae]|uniref:Uncharacterized protein n=1 Tax=Paraburkholderia solisilvae TaxID=624376 RepID=A0A6J5EUL3_9BURK|nr:hypothetical protein LMG29739_05741 [Paraburkholderia solisilvae]
MGLKSNCVYLKLLKILVDKGWNRIPWTRYAVLDEAPVDGDSGVSFNHHLPTVGMPVNDDRIYDPAIRLD